MLLVESPDNLANGLFGVVLDMLHVCLNGSQAKLLHGVLEFLNAFVVGGDWGLKGLQDSVGNCERDGVTG